MAKITIKSAKVSKGEGRCECCGAKIRNIVTIEHMDETTQEIGTTCFRKRFGFPFRPMSATFPIDVVCQGSAVKSIALGLHKKPEFLATCGFTVEQMMKAAELEKAGVKQLCRIEWNRPHYLTLTSQE